MTFLHSFEPGGVERVALRLHSAWMESGIDARLVLGRSEGALKAEWPTLRFRSLSPARLPTGTFETLWMIFRLPAEIRRQRPDLLFCAGNSYTIVAVAMKLLMGGACPPIVAKISNDLERRDLPAPARALYRYWLKVQGRMLDCFVAMAPPMAREIAHYMDARPSRITVIDNPAIEAAWLDLPSARAVPVGGTRYVAAGRLVAQKNFALLIRAFARIAAPEDRLTILGDGPERSRLETLANALGVAHQVGLPGHKATIHDVLRESDVFVLASDYEGLPAVIVEAMAAGLRIVATDCSASMKELLDDGRLGMLVRAGSIDELSDAMRSVLAFQPDLQRARQQAGRFTVERAAAAYGQLFQQQLALASNAAKTAKRTGDATLLNWRRQ